MNILDIITLAKAGYTAKDVKEILCSSAEVNNDSSDKSEPDKDSEDKNIDYKALYEAQIEENNKLKGEIDNAKADLKKAQKDNINSDVSSDMNTAESPETIWENFIKGR